MGYTHFDKVSCANGFYVGASGSEAIVVSSTGAITATASSLSLSKAAGNTIATVTKNLSLTSINFDNGAIQNIASIVTDLTLQPSGGLNGMVGYIILNGGSSNTITFGNGASGSFSSTGTLAVTGGSTYTVAVVKSGAKYYEVSRTAAVTT